MQAKGVQAAIDGAQIEPAPMREVLASDGPPDDYEVDFTDVQGKRWRKDLSQMVRADEIRWEGPGAVPFQPRPIKVPSVEEVLAAEVRKREAEWGMH